MKEVCKDCEFFKVNKNAVRQSGFCLRYPPTAKLTDSILPGVTADHWCGEFERHLDVNLPTFDMPFERDVEDRPAAQDIDRWIDQSINRQKAQEFIDDLQSRGFNAEQITKLLPILQLDGIQ